MPGPRMDTDTTPIITDTASRLSCVLAEVPFPAQSWELLAWADYYGADVRTRAQLVALPAGTYSSLTAVITTLGAVAARRGAHPPL